MSREIRCYIKIIITAMLFGTLGYFVKFFAGKGFSSEMTACSRLFFGWLSLAIVFSIKDRSVFKIDKNGLKNAAIIGLVSHGLFNMCYFTAINMTGAFTAAVLTYFSVVIIYVLGLIFLKEKASLKKTVAVLICLVGCILGVTGGDFSSMEINSTGVMIGLVATFLYSLMPILNKKTILHYNPFTIIIYSFMFAFLFLIPFAKPWQYIDIISGEPSLILKMLIFGIVGSTLPYCLYIPSLPYVQVSMAGVLSTLELATALPIAYFMLGEKINIGMIIGVIIIIFASYLMNKNQA